MSNRFIKKLKKMEGLALPFHFLDVDTKVHEKGLLKMDVVESIHSEGSILVRYYKPISKF